MIDLYTLYYMTNTLYPPELTTLYGAIDRQEATGKKPLIGISANLQEKRSTICNTYVQSILLAGGIPVVIPVHPDISALKEMVETLDGVLLSGGGDINPLYEGAEPLPGLQEYDPVRDQFDLTLLKLAADRQIPVFGICRGHQLINIAFGGKNYQDIASGFEGEALKHSQSTGAEYGTHTVTILENTRLRTLMDAETLLVNSFHHQAVCRAAPGFSVSARSADGMVEAMEGLPEYRIYSVQWHPEKMTPWPDPQMLRLFRFFTGEAALYKQAKAVHSRFPIVDSHCDTPMKFHSGFDLGARHENIKSDLPKLEEGRIDAAFMVAYIPQGPRDSEGLSDATRQAISLLYEITLQVEKNAERVGVAYTPDDLEVLKSAGRRAIFLGIENGYALGDDLKNLALFKEMGVAYITLCHNGSNDICDSARGEAEHGGLSEWGKEVVREMNRLGLLIDISHAGEKSIADVLAISEHPVIASHSSARALCNHPRNLSDEQIREIAARGGVVQVCLYPHFLKNSGEATLADAVAHINHIVHVAGIRHVGIGTDFDGDDTALLPGCKGANELINLTVELLRQGYTPEQLGLLWGGNLMRLLREIQ